MEKGREKGMTLPQDNTLAVLPGCPPRRRGGIVAGGWRTRLGLVPGPGKISQ